MRPPTKTDDMTDRVLIGQKPCGCVEAAGRLEPTLALQWLEQGLILRLVPWAEWCDVYRASFLPECPHTAKDVSA